MVEKNNILEYNFKILSQERKRQKISQENAAIELTLNVAQINSLENNLQFGFITPHFKKIALKRYAKFLGIDFDKIIPSELISNHVAQEEISVAEIEDDLSLGFPRKLVLKISKRYTLIGLLILGLVLIIFFTQPNKDKNLNSEIAITDIDSQNVVPIEDSISTPISKNYIKNKNVKATPKSDSKEIKNTSDIVSPDFICSINSTSMNKVWSHVNPEKPATYFHIVSLKKQSICTIDNRGILKQYNLAEGEKLTHRGEAPFKVQLNSSISELYFQGWKVFLNNNDNFIQLNPVDMPTELN